MSSTLAYGTLHMLCLLRQYVVCHSGPIPLASAVTGLSSSSPVILYCKWRGIRPAVQSGWGDAYSL